MIVLNWVGEHYSDFEEDDSFLDWFEEVLVEDVSYSSLSSLSLSSLPPLLHYYYYYYYFRVRLVRRGYWMRLGSPMLNIEQFRW